MTDRELLEICTIIHSFNQKSVERPSVRVEDAYRARSLDMQAHEPVYDLRLAGNGPHVSF
jgi:hypothetical protein